MRSFLPYFLSFFFPAMMVLDDGSPDFMRENIKGVLPLKPREEKLLDWKSDRPLTWEDYHGRPDPNSDAAASTTTYLAIEYQTKNGQFSYKINSRFSCDKSWGLHKTEYILKHEQGHFDIAEIYARLLHKKMSGYKFDRKTYAKDLKEIYQEVVDAKEETQNKYDKETNHSILKVRQAEWNDKISEMLEKTKAWDNY